MSKKKNLKGQLTSLLENLFFLICIYISVQKSKLYLAAHCLTYHKLLTLLLLKVCLLMLSHQLFKV